ncbi:hypothetical protein FACS1894196_5010 [Clostridia bacterium]|nr:hypothetical protein FACS1894196_5010 [Clostridia bacterium]
MAKSATATEEAQVRDLDGTRVRVRLYAKEGSDTSAAVVQCIVNGRYYSYPRGEEVSIPENVLLAIRETDRYTINYL